MHEADEMTTEETAELLRLFKRNKRTGKIDRTRPDPNKVYSYASRHADFPKPYKRGKSNIYSRAEVRSWLTKNRGGPSTVAASSSKRGPKPKAAQADGGAA